MSTSPPPSSSPPLAPFPLSSYTAAMASVETTQQPRDVPAQTYLGNSVIPIVNKLQDIFAQLGSGAAPIDLPQVAVVGSQSSGKSSVLEALVGRDFLPRGSEICTRRPLVLQLVQLPKPKQTKEDGGNEEGAVGEGEKGGGVQKQREQQAEWGEFLHIPGKRFYDFSAIRSEIQAETEREVGTNKGVSDKQIRLKIYSPHVLNITLVDLPGITKVPVGDQPSDIEARIRTMILSYIKHETCIILAVSPANADLSVSDALQMARIADPDGSRTIGVITKLDIMDRGTDARNFLLGNVIPLKLGYIGIVNRSQQDINANLSIREALAQEESFFRSRPVYHGLADRCGVQKLGEKLNVILVQHIRGILPDLKARINTQIVTLQKELASYGELTESKAGQGALMLNILTRYSYAFTSVVDGKSEDMSTTELAGGARIHYIFQSIFVKSLEEVNPCEDLSDEDIRTAIQNATGPKNVLFVPEVPFEVLVRRQIARLLDPALQCARFVYDELVKIMHRCETFEIQRFPNLRRRLEEVVAGFLREGLMPAETMITHLIEMEMDYINTSHPAFIGGSRAVEEALRGRSAKVQQHLPRPRSDSEMAVERAVLVEKKNRGILARSALPAPGTENGPRTERPTTSGSSIEASGKWGLSSIFGGGADGRANGRDQMTGKMFATDLNPAVEVTSGIQLREVNHVKRDLHSVLIRRLYREDFFAEMLQEKEEIAVRRRRCKEVLVVLQQAAWTLEELPLDYTLPQGSFMMPSTGAASGATQYSLDKGSSHMGSLMGNMPSALPGSPRFGSASRLVRRSYTGDGIIPGLSMPGSFGSVGSPLSSSSFMKESLNVVPYLGML
ncbi:hypothetical protein CBR_g56849 [Chara braunii]|uniref:Dynamin-type G domain-containing protein n=1 Tax=Chara braunii TaxID=69332 RepID=A0A388MDS5_CHABU|nr:hypothetical protein CBR_g56849 [Chara braunii]|eukprot:GBG92710.1 hypothetical protein CBR_g56849 [Chara braunii]